MLKRLEREAVEADLSAIDALLSERTMDDDPIGWFQFQERRATLSEKLASLSDQPALSASVALLFGGLPVVGSRGISADFGTKAVEQFQDVVSKRYAEYHGPLGARGPVKQSATTDLMITDVVRGSFGFVLEEPDNGALLETPLKHVLDDVLDLIYRTSAPDEEAFVAFTETVDPRVLTSLRTFFSHLYSSGATMRLLEDARNIELSRDDIARARMRTDTIEISESTTEATGILYLLPETKRFELHTSDGILRGSVSADLMKRVLGPNNNVASGLLGVSHRVTLNVRTVNAPNVLRKDVFRLAEILDFTT